MEQETLYHALACPRRRLVLSYAAHDAAGKEARPSYIIGTVRRLLEGVPVSGGQGQAMLDRLEGERPAVELAASYLCGSRAPAVEAAYRKYQDDERLLAARNGRLSRGPLTDPRTIDGLYGSAVNLTASRVDRFYSCRISACAPSPAGRRGSPRRRRARLSTMCWKTA